MRAHVVRKVTSFIGSERIDSFHYTMFHGWASRESCPDPDTTYFLDDALVHPLRTVLNVSRINPVVQPRLNLLVLDTIASGLKQLANIGLLRTEPKRVCSISYAEGDFSHWDNPNYRDYGDTPLEMLFDADDVQGIFPSTPNYLEVIPVGLARIASEFPDARGVDANFDQLGRVAFSLSRSMLETYPLLWHEGVFVLSDAIFQILGRHLHHDYYRTLMLEI